MWIDFNNSFTVMFLDKLQNKLELENVHWCSVPVQIGDPIVAPLDGYLWKKYRHPRFAITDTVAQQDVRTWKTVHRSAKVI